MPTAQKRYDEWLLASMGTVPTTAREILDGITARYISPHMTHKYAAFEELRMGTGYGRGKEQRIDLWIMGMWDSEKLARTAFEVKVSRADFRKELKQPLKRRQALRISNLYYFAAPKGIIKPEDVPLDCGLMEFGYRETKPKDGEKPGRRLDGAITVPAPWRDTAPPTWAFLAAIARRIHKAEEAAAAQQAKDDAFLADVLPDPQAVR